MNRTGKVIIASSLVALMLASEALAINRGTKGVAIAAAPTITAGSIVDGNEELLPCEKLKSGKVVAGVPCFSIKRSEALSPMKYNKSKPNDFGWVFLDNKWSYDNYTTPEGMVGSLTYTQTVNNKGKILKAVPRGISYEVRGNQENGFVSYGFVALFSDKGEIISERLSRGVFERDDLNLINLPKGTVEELYHVYLKSCTREAFDIIYDFAASFPRGTLQKMDKEDFLKQFYEHLDIQL